MRICVYEDSGAAGLEPITLTRPAFALWCGAERLFERQRRQFVADEVGFWVRPALAELWKLEQPGHPVNDAAWLRDGVTVWINGRWLPARDVRIDGAVPHVGILNEHVAYAVLAPGGAPVDDDISTWLASWKTRLPTLAINGVMLDHLWDLVEQNGAVLKQDGAWFRGAHGLRELAANVAVMGPTEQLIVAEDAQVEPFVVADTRGGPVLIDHGAIVHSFSRLEGPCYVGRDSWIVGAKLRANSAIGPCCRIGGEVEASIVQGYSNKYHDGFLGHSYLGEWVNLAAATQTSDLRNDYGTVHVSANGKRVDTKRSKVGSYIGDHTKTGLAALFNTGSSIGAFASLLPNGALLPPVVPSFCQVKQGQLQELWDLRKVFTGAARAMERRGKTLTQTHKDFYDDLFEATAKARRQAIRPSDSARLQRSL